MQLGSLGLALERRSRGAPRARRRGRGRGSPRCVELELGAAAALAVLAEPGRLLDEQAPVARLGGHDRLDAALRDDRVGLLAEAGVREQLEHVDEAAAGAVEPVLAVAGAVEAPQDRDLAGAGRRAPSPLSSTISTSAPGGPGRRDRRRRSRPASSGPRTASGDCSPSAHSTASVMFDLPEPFGPTITLTPSPNCSRVRSGKDLKPLIVIDLRCTRSLADARRSPARSTSIARGVLLGKLPAAPVPLPDPRPRPRSDLKVRSCGGPDSPVTSSTTVGRGRARSSCSADSKSTGSRAPRRSRFEGLDDRRRRALEAGDRKHAPITASSTEARTRSVSTSAGAAPRRPAAPPRAAAGHPQLLRDQRGRRSRDRLRADLRQPPGAEVLGLQARIQVRVTDSASTLSPRNARRA